MLYRLLSDPPQEVKCKKRCLCSLVKHGIGNLKLGGLCTLKVFKKDVSIFPFLICCLFSNLIMAKLFMPVRS